MICKQCGAQIDRENAKFCPYCGAILEDVAQGAGGGTQERKPRAGKGTKERKPRAGKPRRWIAVVAVFAVIVALAGAAALWLLNSPAFKVYDALRSGQYNQAASRYNEEVADNVLQQRIALVLVNRYIDNTCADAAKGETSYEEAQARLQPLITFQDKRITSAALERKDQLAVLANSRNAYDEAEKLFGQSNYLRAIEYYATVAETSDLYDAARKRMQECRDSYVERALQATSKLDTREDFEDGLARLNEALEAFPEDEALLAQYADVESGYHSMMRREALESADSLSQQGNYTSAISEIKAAIREMPDDADLLQKRGELEEAYCDVIREQVKELLAEEKFEDAIALIKPARKFFSDRSELDAMLEVIEAERPDYLDSMETLDRENCDFRGDYFYAANDESYNSACIFDTSREAYVVVELDGKYRKMDGWIVSSPRTDEDADMTIEIYADSNLVYRREGCTLEMGAIEFQADLTGAEKLVILTENENYYSEGYLALAQARLFRAES